MGSLALALVASLGIVVIDLTPADESIAQTIAQSCNEGLGAARCVTAAHHAGSARSDESTVRAAVALVGTELSHARIELTLPDASQPKLTRVLEFSPEDDLTERHRAIGLVIASRVLELEQILEAEARARDREPEPKPPPAPPQDDPLAFALELGALAGPGLREGPPRIGGLVRGQLELSRVFGAWIGLRVAHSAGKPLTLWAGASAGLSARLVSGTFGIDAHAGGLVERVDVTVETDARSARGAGVRTGFLLGLRAVLELGADTSIFAGAELSLLFPELVIEVLDRDAFHEEASQVAAVLGARFGL